MGMKHTIFVSDTSSTDELVPCRPRIYAGSITYLSPMVTEVSLFEYCRTSTLVSRRSPIS